MEFEFKLELNIYKSIYKLVWFFSAFFLPMNKQEKKIKNLKIDVDVHNVLKKYCDKRGIKMYKFLENLIMEKCQEKKDIYGEN